MEIIQTFRHASAVNTVRHYIHHALAQSTLDAYKADLDHFGSWGGRIPSTPEMVAEYLSAFAGSLAIATLARRLVAIGKANTMSGSPDPTKSDLVKLTMRGIRRVHGRPQRQAAPILRDDLVTMLTYTPDTLKGARDRALLLLGFCCALRRSELVAVKVEDIQFTSQGLVLMLPRSKTDQTGQGRKIAIPHGRGRVCPVVSVNVWVSQLGANSGPVFRAVTKGSVLSAAAMSDRAVATIIKAYAAKAGLDADMFSGHSLRSGLATSAAQAGISSWKIRQQTGHKSEAMLAKYVRDGDLFRDNASALF